MLLTSNMRWTSPWTTPSGKFPTYALYGGSVGKGFPPTFLRLPPPPPPKSLQQETLHQPPEPRITHQHHITQHNIYVIHKTLAIQNLEKSRLRGDSRLPGGAITCGVCQTFARFDIWQASKFKQNRYEIERGTQIIGTQSVAPKIIGRLRCK